MGNNGEVTAYDPCSNGILTVSASSNIYEQSAYNGVLSEWIQNSSATPNADCVGVGSVTDAYLLWIDQIYVGGLAQGKDVTLLVTFDVSGHLSFDGTYNPNTNQVVCQVEQSVDTIVRDTNYDKSGAIDTHQVFKLHTTSGSVLDLMNNIVGYFNNNSSFAGQANSSFSINYAAIHIDPVTTGALVTSASGVDYATQSQLIAVPSVVSETEDAAAASLVSAGLAVGTIASASSKVIPAGSVIEQVPGAGLGVPSLFPINLLVSSGLPTKTCAADVTNAVSVSESPITYDKAKNLYEQTVTVTNTSTLEFKGPISLVIENLSPGATVHNAKGLTTCDEPGTPFLADTGSLASGHSDEFVLKFSDPSQQTISWSPGITAQGAP
jgi:hypothetical protein